MKKEQRFVLVSQNWVAPALAICACLGSSQMAEAIPLLQYGDPGEPVVSLKNRLKRANCLPEDFSGDRNYNESTRAAVTNLQLQSNLPVDGIARPQTYAALAANQKCKELKLGNRGEAVRRMQTQLDNWGFPLVPINGRLKPTGRFDAETQKTLQEFEQFFASNPDGILDSFTFETLWTPRVVALVKHLENSTFSRIAPALENLKPSEKSQAVSTILSILESSGSYEVSIFVPDSAAALGILQADATMAVPRLLELLRNPQNHRVVRAEAARALGYIGVDANQVILALIAVATNKNEVIDPRRAAARAIGWFGADAKDAVQPLLEILKDPTEDVYLRAGVAEALGDIRVDANQVISTLLKIAETKKENSILPEMAVRAIGRFGADAKDTVEPLLQILKKPTEDTTFPLYVVETLGKIGPAAQAAIPTLIALLNDNNYPIPQLKNRFQEQTLEAELAVVEDTIASARVPTDADRNVTTFREQVSLALAKIGTPAVPELINALQNPDEKIRYSATFALGKIQPPALSAVEPLQAIMNNPNENSNIRWMAASTLETMGQDAQGFFSQTSRKSLDTLARQGCPAKGLSNFVPFVGRCIAQYSGGGGKQVAQRLMQGRRPKTSKPKTSKSNRSSG